MLHVTRIWAEVQLCLHPSGNSADPASKSHKILFSVVSETNLFFNMVADAVIYHPTVAHYLRFVATTGESQTVHISIVEAHSSAQC